MASEPVHASEVLDGPMVGCPACGGAGEGEVGGTVVECSYCRGTARVTLAEYDRWVKDHPWGFGG